MITKFLVKNRVAIKMHVLTLDHLPPLSMQKNVRQRNAGVRQSFVLYEWTTAYLYFQITQQSVRMIFCWGREMYQVLLIVHQYKQFLSVVLIA